MKLEVTKNPNYSAFIFKVENIRKHSNADRLQCVSVAGQNVITDMSTQVGEYYIYFPIECTINKDFLSFLNAFEDKTANADTTKRGFFNKHGRVRAIRLRGERSEGYAIPTKQLADWMKLDVNDLNDLHGISFDTINETSICDKYVPKIKASSGNNGKKAETANKESRLVEDQFRLHTDTDNLRRNTDKIKASDHISVSYKMHGTNATIGKVLCKQQPKSWLEKLLIKLGFAEREVGYDLVWGSRRVVKNRFFSEKKNNPNHYYDEDLWGVMATQLKDKVEDGITLYGEIVGFTTGGAYIQPDYDYGCVPPEGTAYDSMLYNVSATHSNFYVFRISYTDPKGRVHEFTWKEIVAYCLRHGLSKVPLFYDGDVVDFCKENEIDPFDDDKSIGEAVVEVLEAKYLEQRCNMCANDVPNEGVVVTVRPCLEGDEFFNANVRRYKLKSFAFLERETAKLDKGEVGMEEQEEANNE